LGLGRLSPNFNFASFGINDPNALCTSGEVLADFAPHRRYRVIRREHFHGQIRRAGDVGMRIDLLGALGPKERNIGCPLGVRTEHEQIFGIEDFTDGM